MARLTPAQIDAADTYSNAQMLKLARLAIAELVSDNQAAVTVGGRSYTFQDLGTLREIEAHYRRLAAEDAAATDLDSTGCPVVTYQEPQI